MSFHEDLNKYKLLILEEEQKNNMNNEDATYYLWLLAIGMAAVLIMNWIICFVAIDAIKTLASLAQ